jgi:hypothetical protein
LKKNKSENKYGDPRFYRLLEKMGEIYEKKSADYSGETPFKDWKEVEDIGIPAWKGTIVRLLTKIGRIKTLTKNDNPKCDETMNDTLLDIACMSLITIILRDKGRQKAD